MLQTLKIENYAIIDALDIDFSPGLNTITGETGAGKSILLGALSLLSGSRTDTSVIRDGEQRCVIEGNFLISPYSDILQPLFQENELDWEEQLTIRRVVSSNGKSRAFVNDLPVNLQVLKSITEPLIDIHSQHQTLLLSTTGFQTRIVDIVAGQEKTAKEYRLLYQKWNRLTRELAACEQQARERLKERDYLSFQAEQLAGLKYIPGESQTLQAEENLLTHAEEIATVLNECGEALLADEQGVNSAVRRMAGQLARLIPNYPQAEELAQRMESVRTELKDLAQEMESRRDRIEIDPARLEQVRRRLDEIYTLGQKHQIDDPEEFPGLLERLERQLESMDDADRRTEGLKKEIATLEESIDRLAAGLSEGRRKTAPKISKSVRESLQELGIAGASFEVRIEPLPEGSRTADGTDTVKMLFSANTGMAPQPIEQVASGGEMSRVMLALKGLTARSKLMPTVIFDEIDTGVSGRVADKMGEIIARMGTQVQVLNITHLPQIASKGEHHYYVHKQPAPTGETTRIRKLGPAEREEHIAAMLSGTQVTDAARKQAAELLKNS